MFLAACMSLSSFVLQLGHSNILSVNFKSTLFPHLEQYFVVGNHLSKIITLSDCINLDLILPSTECCILVPEKPSCCHLDICSSCNTMVPCSFNIFDTILFETSFFILVIWLYSFLIFFIVLYLLLEPFFLRLSCV